MSTHSRNGIRTLKLLFKLGSKVSNIIWHITETGNDQITIISKHPKDEKDEIYVLFRRNTPEINKILQQ